jgi:hypothetical protein
MGASVRDTDHGYSALMQMLERIPAGLEMTIGLHEEEGAEPTRSGLSVVEVAELNEFGSPGGLIPARPAITGWADTAETMVLGDVRNDLTRALSTRTDPLPKLDARAQKYAGDIQARIAAGVPPPNADSTVKKKGSSTPLIDLGVFRSSITGKVKPK